MLVFAAAKALGQRPNDVRTWDEDELLGLVAYGQLEAEAVKERQETAAAPTAAPARSAMRGQATQATRTVIYRVGPKPTKPKE
ncbi:hypothetical protein [Myxococcus sp. Y35]|uniref:hypothetical protein n=1 Tax=Pseudomyxococcus flavus TaxID=3115648 RepID=UPI003CF8CCAB